MEKWNIDRVHSSITFAVKHLVIARVRGRFTRWSGFINLDETSPARSEVKVRIDASSVDTGQPDRDGHLRSPDFLSVESFPELTFVSARVEKVAEQRYRVFGELTVRGVPGEIVLDVREVGRARDPWGAQRVGFSARTSFDRRNFGLRWNQAVEAGGLLVGDRVDVDIEVEAVKAPAEAKAA